MIVVTGGAGFIGSNVVQELNRRGRYDILVVDNLRSSEKWRHLVPLSISDYMTREEFLKHIKSQSPISPLSAVIHLGACSSTTEKDCDFLLENNYRYTQHVVEYCRQKKLRCIIASSAAVYGNGSLGFSDDPDLVHQLRPLNMYGYSKLLVDRWLFQEKKLDGVASLRFFNVYGPNEDHKGPMQSVVRKAFYEIQKTEKAVLFKSNDPEIPDGEQKRDFVYVKDCARIIADLVDRQYINGIFNVGTGSARSFKDLVLNVFKALDIAPCILFTPMPESLSKNYQNYTCADITRISGTLPHLSMTSLEDGVHDYVLNHLVHESC